MLVPSMSGAFKLPRLNRRVLQVVALVVGFPILLLVVARLLATDLPKKELLEVARVVLEEYVGRNPPNKTWKLTATRVSEQGKLEMDVDVANYEQAQVILSRSGRIRYSYMKLACPDLESDVYRHLPQNETIWIQLHYHGTPIVRGACPLSKSVF